MLAQSSVDPIQRHLLGPFLLAPLCDSPSRMSQRPKFARPSSVYISTREDSGAALERVSVPEQPGKECRFPAIYCQLRRHEFIPLPCPWEGRATRSMAGTGCVMKSAARVISMRPSPPFADGPQTPALSHGSKFSQREAELGGFRWTARMTPERCEKRIVQFFCGYPWSIPAQTCLSRQAPFNHPTAEDCESRRETRTGSLQTPLQDLAATSRR
jgi:hypothetical protein